MSHSENLFRDMTDRLVEDGWKELGYEYVIIDDCWMSMQRDAGGRLQPDPSRWVHVPQSPSRLAPASRSYWTISDGHVQALMFKLVCFFLLLLQVPRGHRKTGAVRP